MPERPERVEAEHDAEAPLVFFSWSASDGKRWMVRLRNLLTDLIHTGHLRVWDDVAVASNRIKDNWEEAHAKAMRTATVAVVVITKEYPSSSAAGEREIPALLKRQQSGHLTIVPVLVEPSERIPRELRELKSFPPQGFLAKVGPEVDAEFRSLILRHTGIDEPSQQLERDRSRPEVVRQVQLLLQAREKSLATDGVAGLETRGAIERFQSAEGVPVDGEITPALLKLLRAKLESGRDEWLLDVRAMGSTVVAAKYDEKARVWALDASGYLLRYSAEVPSVERRNHLSLSSPRSLELSPAGGEPHAGERRAAVIAENALFFVNEEGRASKVDHGIVAARFDVGGRLATAEPDNVVVRQVHVDARPLRLPLDEPVFDLAWGTEDTLFVEGPTRLRRLSLEGTTVATCELPPPVSSGPEAGHVVAVSPDGLSVVVLRGNALVLNASTLATRYVIDVGDDDPSSVTFSPDSRWLVLGLASGRVEVREALSPRIVRSWKAHADRIVSLAFQREEPRLVTAGGDTVKVWRFPLSAGATIAVLTSDLDHADEPLGIARDVAAFSRVLLAKDLKPPLSVGLFGDWGSGKSFFIEHLRKRIRADADGALGAQRRGAATALVGHVVQVTFNAWHYLEANLWAGLVSHLFDELGRLINPEEPPAETRKKLLANLETSRVAQAEATDREKAAEKRVMAVSERVAQLTAEEERIRAASVQLESSVILRTAIDWLASQARANPDEQQAEEVLDEWSARVRKLRTRSGRIVEAMKVAYSGGAIAIAAVVVAVVASAWWLWLHQDALAKQVVGGLLASATAVVGWIVRVAQIAREPTEAAVAWAEKVTMPATALAEAQRLRATKQLAAAVTATQNTQGELKLTRTQLAQATAELAVATEAVEQAKHDLEEANTGRVLFRFLSERTRTDEYRRHLGLVSVIRRDLLELSRLVGVPLDDQPAPKELVARIDRIVLYIDDLDRCPPARVVEVLEAVHVMLGMRLFVVVVAVDSRWLMRSLHEHYGKLLPVDAKRTRDAAAVRFTTPRQFLEKIFQIPFVVPPLDKTLYQNFVHLLVPVEEPEAPEEASSGDPARRVPSIRLVARAPGSANPALPPAPKIATAAPEGDGDVPAKGNATDVVPSTLKLTLAEREFIEQLVLLLSTPRSVKALVNVYRVLRARLETPAPDEPTMEQFLVKREYCVVLLLLAMQIGEPLLAQEMASDLTATGEAGGLVKLDEYIKNVVGKRADWQKSAKLIAQLQGNKLLPADLQLYRDWWPRVRRFSFEPWIAPSTGRQSG
jgi:hypothetical protein